MAFIRWRYSRCFANDSEAVVGVFFVHGYFRRCVVVCFRAVNDDFPSYVVSPVLVNDVWGGDREIACNFVIGSVATEGVETFTPVILSRYVRLFV